MTNYRIIVDSFDELMNYLVELINKDKDYLSVNGKPFTYDPNKDNVFKGINLNAIRSDLEFVAREREQYGMRLQDIFSTDHNERYDSYVSATYVEGAPIDSKKWSQAYDNHTEEN